MCESPVPYFPVGNGIRSDGHDCKAMLVIFFVGLGDHFEQLDLRRGMEKRWEGESIKVATE